jgi:mannitol/fructose-specific phosphotransferase system IIA component (Ntr-type)/Kef-type K+ transport system membrane component KefB
MGILFGTLAISTAPATIVTLVREARARGVFVKTLLGAVALNNMACIVLFEVARVFARAGLEPGQGLEWKLGVARPTLQVLEAVAIGGGAAILVNLVQRILVRQDQVATLSIMTILLTVGVADYLDVSPLLACLFLGLVQTNTNPDREKVIDRVFLNFEPAILAVFFTLAGMHLDFDYALQAGSVAAAVLAARALGKIASVRVAMKLAGATDKVRRYLGPALLPQAGVAIGLVILVQEDPAFSDHTDLVGLFVAVGLTMVTVNEIVGPIFTRRALALSGEAGMDRSRLFDFIQEENIVIGLRAQTKPEAIERLVDVMIASHHLEGVDRRALLRSVLDREEQVSTCLGGGLAVPHGTLPDGRGEMVGVMGLSQQGLSFKTPDGRPVHCMVLLATSKKGRDRHLQVLAALARTIGSDAELQTRLFSAESAAHAYEILHGERAESFNTFLA